jgi:hypothetical protein
MDDTRRVDVLDGAHDGTDQAGSVGLIVVSFGTDAVKELATSAEVKDEVEIVGGFKIVVEGYDVAMATGDMLEDRDFITNLDSSIC